MYKGGIERVPAVELGGLLEVARLLNLHGIHSSVRIPCEDSLQEQEDVDDDVFLSVANTSVKEKK